MTATTWAPPPLWSVPRDWPGARCFVLCSGESIGAQRAQIARLRGRFIAVKHGVLIRPDADVLFLSGEGTPAVAADLVPRFRGRYIVVRGKSDPELDRYGVHRVTRSKQHDRLSDRPDHVCGRDSGTSAIDLAWHFGATEIVLLGYDMRGGHFCPHPLPRPPQDHFDRHMAFLPQLAADAARRGVRIVNCSPGSAVTAFAPGRLEDFL